jgi:hypothetical protein
MKSSNKSSALRRWLLLPGLLLGFAVAAHAQVPDLAPPKKPAQPAPVSPAPPPAEQPKPAPAPAPVQEAPAPVVASPAAAQDGPFGFYAGETRAQVIAAIGKAAIKSEKKDTLEVTTSPKPDPHFDTFTLILSPRAGLLKVVATGKDQNDDATGVKVRAEYAAVKSDVTAVYGPATESFDFIKSTSKHKGADEFILALTNSERTLAAYWTKSAFPNSVNSISLEADGLGNDLGYLSLEFEFNGYAAYITGK